MVTTPFIRAIVGRPPAWPIFSHGYGSRQRGSPTRCHLYTNHRATDQRTQDRTRALCHNTAERLMAGRHTLTQMDQNSDLLRPSLSADHNPAAAIYSLRTEFLTSFFGGPIAG